MGMIPIDSETSGESFRGRPAERNDDLKFHKSGPPAHVYLLQQSTPSVENNMIDVRILFVKCVGVHDTSYT